MRTEDFDYELASSFVAQRPVEPRDACRLMVVDRASGQIDHRAFSDIREYLRAGDALVLNETRVLPARLKGTKEEGGAEVEVLLLRERYAGTWECLVKPGRRLQPGARVSFGDGSLTALIVERIEESGGRLVQFKTAGGTLLDALHRFGETPLPPYVTTPLDDPELYQTVYATDERSVAAPTAGLHFTPDLLEAIEADGVESARVQLDIGLDTFRPVTEEDPTTHTIHSEHVRVSELAADVVRGAQRTGRRVIAVGTTSVRAIESAWDEESGRVEAVEGTTDLFILPGHHFNAVDAMVTNFHLPRSTLLMMVSAFAGRELVLEAYETAKERGYRFYSFGDAMLIL